MSLHTLVPVMSLLALLGSAWSLVFTWRVNGRLLRLQKHAYDYASATVARTFAVEMAARRALAVWELGAWRESRPGSEGWIRLADAFENLREQIDEVDVVLAGEPQ